MPFRVRSLSPKCFMYILVWISITCAIYVIALRKRFLSAVEPTITVVNLEGESFAPWTS